MRYNTDIGRHYFGRKRRIKEGRREGGKEGKEKGNLTTRAQHIYIQALHSPQSLTVMATSSSCRIRAAYTQASSEDEAISNIATI